ncbi:Lsr2 dimerization domain-containing protein [Gordonia sp. MP11Mi]
MAVIRVFDDVNGAEIDDYETVKWSLDGIQYEFDASREHAEEFRNHVTAYIAASRPASEQLGRRTTTSRSTSHVREWAIANGYSFGARGRVPKYVQIAYEAVHRT